MLTLHRLAPLSTLPPGYFNFFVRYAPGASVPSGFASFTLRPSGSLEGDATSDITLDSKDLKWLVVTYAPLGARIQLQGTGTINGGSELYR